MHRELKAILQQLPSPPPPTPLPLVDPSQPTTLALLLSQPVLAAPSHALPSGSVQLADEPSMASDFCKFVLDRVRREDAAVRISRISRVLTGGARMATYMDLFMREAGSRSSNPMLRPANPSDAASVAGLSKLKSLFERTCLGASPPCNIVFAWHGTPAQYVEAVCPPRRPPRLQNNRRRLLRRRLLLRRGAGVRHTIRHDAGARARVMFAMVSCVHTLNQAPSASGEYPVICSP